MAAAVADGEAAELAPGALVGFTLGARRPAGPEGLSDEPGPGAYAPPAPHDAVAFSLAPRTPLRRPVLGADSPGPTTAGQEALPRGAAVLVPRMRAPPAEHEARLPSPNPWEYTPSHTAVRPAAPAFAFPRTTHLDMFDGLEKEAAETPAPNAYLPASDIGTGTAAKFGERTGHVALSTLAPGGLVTPSPAAYSPNDPARPRSRGYEFDKAASERLEATQDAAGSRLGPGTYDPDRKPSAQTYTFAKAPRKGAGVLLESRNTEGGAYASPTPIGVGAPSAYLTGRPKTRPLLEPAPTTPNPGPRVVKMPRSSRGAKMPPDGPGKHIGVIETPIPRHIGPGPGTYDTSDDWGYGGAVITSRPSTPAVVPPEETPGPLRTPVLAEGEVKSKVVGPTIKGKAKDGAKASSTGPLIGPGTYDTTLRRRGKAVTLKTSGRDQQIIGKEPEPESPGPKYALQSGFGPRTAYHTAYRRKKPASTAAEPSRRLSTPEPTRRQSTPEPTAASARSRRSSRSRSPTRRSPSPAALMMSALLANSPQTPLQRTPLKRAPTEIFIRVDPRDDGDDAEVLSFAELINNCEAVLEKSPVRGW